MHTILQREVMLRDAVYNIAKLVHDADDTITHVKIETSDQGEYLTASGVRWGNLADSDLEDALEVDDAVSVEDWASSLSWDDAKDEVQGWVVLNHRGGYYEIDVDEALKATPPVEIKPVDLVTGVLALHIPSHRTLTNETVCLCGMQSDGLIAFRQHLAEKIVEVLS